MSDDSIMRGVKFYLNVSSTNQKMVLEDWLGKTVRLWNLLLDLQKAAYSGENSRSELGWRQLWVDILRVQYERDKRIWDQGRPPNKKRKGIEAGIVRQRRYREELRVWEALPPEERKTTKKPVEPKPPQPLSLDKLKAILATDYPPLTLEEELGLRAKMSHQTVKKIQRNFRKSNNPMRFPDVKRRAQAEERIREADAIIERHLENPRDCCESDCPKLFIWEQELLALVARLKTREQTAWIADLPSCAAQRVAKDLCNTLRKMVTQGAGFPRYKSAKLGEGSIYIDNTKFAGKNLRLSDGENYVILPKGFGELSLEACEKRLDRKSVAMTSRCNHPQFKQGGVKRQRERVWKFLKDGVLQGGRVYCQGNRWVLSLQYKLPKPDPLPETGRAVGVKIAAAVLLTTSNDREVTRQANSIQMSPRNISRWRFLELRKSRQELALKKKEKKLRDRAERRGKILKKRPNASEGYKDTLSKMSRIRTVDNERRRRFMHRETTRIVRDYDEITVQLWKAAPLMRKVSKKQQGEFHRRKSVPAKVRKIMSRAAPSATGATLKYKATDAGRVFNETPVEFKDVQTCSACGGVNPKMRDGRRVFSCDHCGYKIHKDKNAAKNEYKLGKLAKGT